MKYRPLSEVIADAFKWATWAAENGHVELSQTLLTLSSAVDYLRRKNWKLKSQLGGKHERQKVDSTGNQKARRS